MNCIRANEATIQRLMCLETEKERILRSFEIAPDRVQEPPEIIRAMVTKKKEKSLSNVPSRVQKLPEARRAMVAKKML